MQLFSNNCVKKILNICKPAHLATDSLEGELSRDERAFFMRNDRPRIGRWGEDTAAAFLESSGLEILERNVRSRFSELDIIARDGKTLVVVEVRCRRRTHFSSAQATVGPRKWKHLASGGERYVMTHDWSGPWRIDLVAIDVDNIRWKLHWMKYLEMQI